MMHLEPGVVLKYFEPLDHFVKVRRFSPEEIGRLRQIRQAHHVAIEKDREALIVREPGDKKSRQRKLGGFEHAALARVRAPPPELVLHEGDDRDWTRRPRQDRMRQHVIGNRFARIKPNEHLQHQ